MTPASTNAELISRPASWIVTGVPVTSGATVRTRRDESFQRRVIARVPRGKISTRARPSGVIQLFRNSGGNVSSVTGPAVDYEAQRVKALFQPASSDPAAAPELSPRRASRPRREHRRDAAPRSADRRCRFAGGDRLQRARANRPSPLRSPSLVGSGSIVSGLNVGPIRSWRSAENRELLLLIGGDEACRGNHLRYLGQLRQPAGERFRLVQRRRD